MANEKLHIPFSKHHHHRVRVLTINNFKKEEFSLENLPWSKRHPWNLIPYLITGRNHLLEKDRRRQLNTCLWKLNLQCCSSLPGWLQLLWCTEQWLSLAGRQGNPCDSSTGTCWAQLWEWDSLSSLLLPKALNHFMLIQFQVFVQTAACVLYATRIHCTQNVGVVPNIVLSCQKLWPSSGRMEMNKHVTEENY